MELYVIANLGKPETLAALPRVASAAARLGIRLVAERKTAELLGDNVRTAAPPPDADAALVLGGDGSMLRAARLLGAADLPVAVVNTGTLGYMACADVARLDETLLALRDGVLVEEPRRMIGGLLRSPESEESPKFQAQESREIGPALNDIVVSRGDTGRILSLDLSIDGEPVTTYLCDGLIVATPTGSTAYSLSAGGPILSPKTHAIVVNVICPHSLSSRPLVLPDTAEIDIRVRRAAVVSADGQDGVSLPVGGSLRVARSPRVVRLLRFPERDEFAVLRQKLGWSGTAPRG